ncbi:MAG: ATPase [Hyphomicrobiales bacterium]|nr:MAG: ATPase [Hyphomicrobiales bacterium]
MREFLDDAHAHRDDGYGRAQKHVKRELPKRFYKDAAVVSLEGGFGVGLDGRVPKTPGQKQVLVPLQPIAVAMAAEWAAQGEFIDPETMPLVRLVNSAVEAGEETMPALRAEIVKYAGNDLLLYRADTPDSLVKRQEAHWDGALVKLARQFEVSFQPTMGILHQPQPAATLSKVGELLADEPLLPLTAMNAVMSITGSGLLALALRHGLLDAEAVWAAAHVDEDHNIELWGEVEEITTRRGKRRKEFDAAVRLLEMTAR